MGDQRRSKQKCQFRIHLSLEYREHNGVVTSLCLLYEGSLAAVVYHEYLNYINVLAGEGLLYYYLTLLTSPLL